jgi:hypothetical protein
MATLLQNSLGLLELAKRTGNKTAIAIAEVLDQTLELQDAVYLPANGPTTHTLTRRASLPSGSWRTLNDGVKPENSTTYQVVEQLGILESFSKVDDELLQLAPDKAAFRESEDMSFVEGLGQTFAKTIVYGDPVSSPGSFLGLAGRLNSLAQVNVTSAGGSGEDCTSIYIVQWGPKRAYMAYPPNSPVGLQAEDLGVQLMPGVTSNTLMKNWVSHFVMRGGLCVGDDRCIQRYCNIETAGTSNTFNDDHLIAILNRLPFQGKGAVIYANSTVKTQMDIKAKNQTNINYSFADFGGRSVTTFKGVPVRQLDSILNTETAVG